jgi:probable HAF family extracellular repeat protein
MTRWRFWSLLFASELIVGLASRPGHAAPPYNIVALDVLPGGLDSSAFGLNDQGQAVGDSRLDRSGNVGQSRPVLWNDAGQPVELWTEPFLGGSAADINNSGLIVGRYDSGSGIPLPTPGVLPGRAFVWNADAGRRDLGLQPFGNSMAVAVNDRGQVAGTSEVFETVIIDGQPTLELVGIRPFIWDAANGIRDLGTLGGAAFAEDINALGQVVGRSENESGRTRAFVWDEIQGMRELPTLGQSSQASSINDQGEVLGFDFGIGPVIWDLRTGARREAEAGLHLNNRGQILGGSSIWDETHGRQMLSDLIRPDSGWELRIATAINEFGQIIGAGTFRGERRGFLMTPVPEPSSLSLLVLSFLASVGYIGRGQRRGWSQSSIP